MKPITATSMIFARRFGSRQPGATLRAATLRNKEHDAEQRESRGRTHERKREVARPVGERHAPARETATPLKAWFTRK